MNIFLLITFIVAISCLVGLVICMVMLNNVSGRVDTIKGREDTINGTEVNNLGLSRDSPIDQLFVKNVSRVWDNGEVTEALIDSKKIIDFTNGTTDKFYPVSFKFGQDDWAPANFTVTGTDGKADGDTYNDCTIFGTLRGGASSDHRPFCMLTMKTYRQRENRFCGVFRTSACWDIVIYMRGGYRYSVSSTTEVAGHINGYEVPGKNSIRKSVFPVLPDPKTLATYEPSAWDNIDREEKSDPDTGNYLLRLMINLQLFNYSDGTYTNFNRKIINGSNGRFSRLISTKGSGIFSEVEGEPRIENI